ncbi:MAG: protein kinase [Myxococcales bacterium]|nr:protein kinase [Myxococcales bacterium]
MLGEGGFGKVFIAHDAQLGRDVALKVLLPEHSGSPEILQRFFHEARAAAAIQHAGIVMVFEYGRIEGTATAADGSAFIAMELLPGESLAGRLRRAPRLTTEEVVAITRQIAAAVGAAHAEGIVHRDLKPDNVFLVPDDEARVGFRVKVLDFGIAKLQGGHGAGAGHTRTMMVFGTPPYMSPEQCRSSARIDHRSDIYALGCIVFEMLCGRTPFVADEPGELIALHQLQPPPPPSSLAPVDPALEALVMAMLAKRADDRPPTMDAVRAALDRRTREQAAVAPPPASYPPASYPPGASPAGPGAPPPPAHVAAHAPPLRHATPAPEPVPASAPPGRASGPQLATTLRSAAGSADASMPGMRAPRRWLVPTVAVVGVGGAAALVAVLAGGGGGDRGGESAGAATTAAASTAATGATGSPARGDGDGGDDRTSSPGPAAPAALAPIFGDDFQRGALGPRYTVTGPGWSIDQGTLVARRVEGHPVWLDVPLPADARIALDVRSHGDLVVLELWGDGRDHAQVGSQQHRGTGYRLVFAAAGAALLRERPASGPPLSVSRNDVKLEKARRYHIEVVRRGGRIDWMLDRDPTPFLTLLDPSPLPDAPASYLGLGGGLVWREGASGPIHYDNLEIAPLAPDPAAPAVTPGPPRPDAPLPPADWVRVAPPDPPVRLGVPADHPEALTGFRPDRDVRSPARPYWILAEEVRGEALAAFAKRAGATWKGAATRAPASNVPFALARAYCQALGGDLPSEEEFELAARGPELRPYPWGDAPRLPATGDATPDSPAIRKLLAPPREWVRDLARTDATCPADRPACEAYFTSDGKEIGMVRGLTARELGGELPPLAAAARSRLYRAGPDLKKAEPLLADVGFRCVRHD